MNSILYKVKAQSLKPFIALVTGPNFKKNSSLNGIKLTVKA